MGILRQPQLKAPFFYSGVDGGVRNVSLLNIEKIGNGLRTSLPDLFRLLLPPAGPQTQNEKKRECAQPGRVIRRFTPPPLMPDNSGRMRVIDVSATTLLRHLRLH